MTKIWLKYTMCGVIFYTMTASGCSEETIERGEYSEEESAFTQDESSAGVQFAKQSRLSVVPFQKELTVPDSD